MSLNSPAVGRLIRLAIDEDLSYGDITSELAVPENTPGRAVLLAREKFVFCGGPILPLIFAAYGTTVQISRLTSEGSHVADGTVLAEFSGSLGHLLALERTILNFLQRLSGVATGARRYVEQAAGLTVLDTLKTTPGWRVLEKYAVRIGGAKNHRMGLGDMLLVKNNHIDVCGGVAQALERVLAGKPYYMPVEVEVRNEQELRAALEFDVQVVMLDNMDDEQIKGALALIAARRPQTQVEISGGITAERLPRLKALGVQCISIGALTTKAANVDISMRIEGR